MTDDGDKHVSANEIPSTLSSRSLVLMRQGESTAWTRMVDRYFPMVYRWCRRKGLQPDDAKDVCQEVFKSVATSLHRFEREHVAAEFEPKTWQAFWRTAVAQQAAKDVAEDLGISCNAVYLARSRVMRRLRRAFDEMSRSCPQPRSDLENG